MRSFKDLREKKLTPAEMKKREEIAKAMERDNPGMDMGKKMAIATATAKKVAEEAELEEGAKTHFVYQKGVPKSKQVVHRGTEQSSKDWITKNAKHYLHKGKDFDIYKGKYPNVKPSDQVDFKHVAEEVQIDEGIENMPHGRLKWHMNTGVPHGSYTKAELKKEKARRLSRVDTHKAYVKAKPSMNEESLDITEISLDMLTKKISNSGMATTKKANKMDKTKKDLEAMKARLAGKPALAKEAKEDDEPASPDEASMALKQLEFIEYAAEEMMDHIKSGKEFPEWFQNKLSKAHGEIEGLHSSMGEHGEDEEDMKEATEVSELSKKTLGSYVKKAAGSAAGISAVATAQAMSSKGKSDPNDKRQLRNRLTGVSRATDKLTKEEVTEAKRKGAPKMTGDSFAMQRAKDAELNKALGRTKTGRKKPARQMTSTQRSLAQLRGESVQSADKKPEKYIKPDGKVGIRMVRVDKDVIKANNDLSKNKD